VHTAGGGGGSLTAQLRVKPGNLLAQTVLERAANPASRSAAGLGGYEQRGVTGIALAQRPKDGLRG